MYHARAVAAPADYDAAPAEYDALADLFLGEVGTIGSGRGDRTARTSQFDSDSGAALTGDAAPSPHRSDGLRSPRLRLTGGDESATDASLRRVATPVLDELPVARAPVSTTPVELIVLGHLPVLGSVWAMQYAREAAREEGGPVAFLRLSGDQATLELVGPDDAAHADPASVRSGFAGALAWCALRARRWIVRADAGREVDAAAAEGVSAITLLTCADEAARVGAYRAIKDLAGSLEVREGSTPALVRVVVMSAEGDQPSSQSAADALAGAASRLLGRVVESRALVGRIRSARAPSTVFSGRIDLSPQEAVHAIRTTPVDARTPPVAPAIAPPAPTPNPVEPPVRQPSPVVSMPGRAVPSPAQAAPASADRSALLASYIAGATPVTARCPYAPQVELARDADGAMLLLARVYSPQSIDAALGSVMTARAWAISHADLLDAAEGRPHAALSREPTLHLFFADPRSARPLLETDLRIHLLAPVTVDGRSGWYHADMN